MNAVLLKVLKKFYILKKCITKIFFHKVNSTNIIRNVNEQISILEGFLKDQVTLKT